MSISCATDEYRGVEAVNTKVEEEWLIDKTPESVDVEMFVGYLSCRNNQFSYFFVISADCNYTS